MKYVTILIILFFSLNIFGQVQSFNEIPKEILEQLDNMGIDNSPLLNSSESDYFNVIFKDNLKGFDFSKKRIGFIYSGTKTNKEEYFRLEKNRFHLNYTPNGGILYIFNTEQKMESGGYDAAIVYWSKFMLPVERVIKRLKKQRK